MKPTTDQTRRQIAGELEEVVENARELARRFGLDGYPVNYWVVDYDEMNELIAYDGFPARYPHWRWGMKYDRQRKQDRYGAGKAFEIVVNDDPAHAYLQESNESADQKAVITHVEAHADFFCHNRWYQLFADDVNAVTMLEQHADQIQSYMADPEIGRAAVERWIDNVLPLTDTIDQQRSFGPVSAEDSPDSAAMDSPVADLAVSEDVRDAVFDDEWIERQTDPEDDDEPARDVLAVLRRRGKQYDDAAGKAVEMEDWQKHVLDMLRREAYYFAPQQTTKVMNEGFAAYFESLMMGAEAFAGDDEFLRYADHQSRVLGSPGLNPYKLGKELWEYVENVANRREVVTALLRIDGVTWQNFHDTVDFDRVREYLEPTPPLDSITQETLPDLTELDQSKLDGESLDRALDGEIDVERHPWKVLSHDGLAERHFSLTRPRNHGFIEAVGPERLEEVDRYLFDDDRHASVEAALDEVAYTAGWDRLFEVRESHNDVTFLDEFLTPEFVRQNGYFTHEYSHAAGESRVASTDPEDVRKKLLLEFANFGKPTIVVADSNYENRNELLLAHEYNGVQLDLGQAVETLKRVFALWGRPVNLKTVVKELDDDIVEAARKQETEPTPEEAGRLLRYDGDEASIQTLAWEDVSDIAAEDVDYDTKPDEWL